MSRILLMKSAYRNAIAKEQRLIDDAEKMAEEVSASGRPDLAIWPQSIADEARERQAWYKRSWWKKLLGTP